MGQIQILDLSHFPHPTPWACKSVCALLMDVSSSPLLRDKEACPVNCSRLPGKSQLGSVTIWLLSRRVSGQPQHVTRSPREIGAGQLVYPALVCTASEQLVTKLKFLPPLLQGCFPGNPKKGWVPLLQHTYGAPDHTLSNHSSS